METHLTTAFDEEQFGEALGDLPIPMSEHPFCVAFCVVCFGAVRSVQSLGVKWEVGNFPHAEFLNGVCFSRAEPPTAEECKEDWDDDDCSSDSELDDTFEGEEKVTHHLRHGYVTRGCASLTGDDCARWA